MENTIIKINILGVETEVECCKIRDKIESIKNKIIRLITEYESTRELKDKDSKTFKVLRRIVKIEDIDYVLTYHTSIKNEEFDMTYCEIEQIF